MIASASRHRPEDWVRTLAFRPRSELPFDISVAPPAAAVMLDTTVYVDQFGRRGLPQGVKSIIEQRAVLHAGVACAEIAVAIGHLDPAHPGTPRNRSTLERVLAAIDPLDTRVPSAGGWTEAAVIAGILARVQGYPKEARRELLLDALIFLTALESEAVLISRNVRHMDLLLRFRPDAHVLLYDRS